MVKNKKIIISIIFCVFVISYEIYQFLERNDDKFLWKKAYRFYVGNPTMDCIKKSVVDVGGNEVIEAGVDGVYVTMIELNNKSEKSSTLTSILPNSNIEISFSISMNKLDKNDENHINEILMKYRGLLEMNCR